MDLIYMDSTRLELGILQHYTLDLDIAEEKDFELKTLDDEIILEAGFWFYIPGTEYGGRIDKVKHDTNSKTVIYTGRNWRGILNSKIIEPNAGSSYVYADGSVAEALSGLIARSGLSELFVVDTSILEGEEQLTTPLFPYPRFCTLYEGIIALLKSVNGKLRIVYDPLQQKVSIKPVLIEDHSDYLTYISANSLNFVVAQRNGGINHLVCLGQGVEDTRAVIHLFLDENNALQPYRLTDTPVRNTDYILDKSSQVIDGLDERAAVYDYPNAEITYNYVLLGRIPGDWQTNYKHYYCISEDQEDDDLSTLKYVNVEPVVQEIYSLTESKPGDWEAGQGKYYTFDGSEYHPVGLVESAPTYNYYDAAPDDWKNNYNEYYVETWNGVEYVYNAVTSEASYKHKVQESKPDDWVANFKSYYMLKTDAAIDYRTKKYTRVTKGTKAPKWKANTYYEKSGDDYKVTKKEPSKWDTEYYKYYTMEYVVPTSIKNATTKYVNVQPTASGKAPTWKANKYYTRYTSYVAPKFEKSTVGTQKIVTKVTTQVMPEWESDMYYAYTKLEVAPPFTTGTYYEKTEDWYKVLVEGGIERLADLNKTESQSVTLADMPAEIGDIVSGYDLITQIEVYEPVTNIIVKIKNNVLSIDYEVGGKN